MRYLIEKINKQFPFEIEEKQLFGGTHGQYTPAIRVALYYVKQFLGF